MTRRLYDSFYNIRTRRCSSSNDPFFISRRNLIASAPTQPPSHLPISYQLPSHLHLHLHPHLHLHLPHNPPPSPFSNHSTSSTFLHEIRTSTLYLAQPFPPINPRSPPPQAHLHAQPSPSRFANAPNLQSFPATPPTSLSSQQAIPDPATTTTSFSSSQCPRLSPLTHSFPLLANPPTISPHPLPLGPQTTPHTIKPPPSLIPTRQNSNTKPSPSPSNPKPHIHHPPNSLFFQTPKPNNLHTYPTPSPIHQPHQTPPTTHPPSHSRQTPKKHPKNQPCRRGPTC